MDDFLTNKELSEFKNDVESSNNAVSVSKYAFERELKNGLGEEIINYLNNPPLFDEKKEKKVQKLRKRNERKEILRRKLRRIFKRDKKNPEEF